MIIESWSTSSTSAAVTDDQTQLAIRKSVSWGRKCRVPGCVIPRCQLVTHQKYVPTRFSQTREKQQTGNAASIAIEAIAVKDEGCRIQRDGVDGFPRLPVDNPLSPELRSLFHHFFEFVFEPLAQAFRGPSVLCMTEYKTRMLSNALNSESYCMGLIVQAQTDIDNARHARESQQSVGVYTQAVTSFRKQLASVQQIRHPLQIELALLTLCTLISYDALHSRAHTLAIHWRGLENLVEQRGGLHCVTVSLAYVVHVDRICAQSLDEPPKFSNPLLLPLPLPRPKWPKYGTNFVTINDEDHRSDHSIVVKYCMDTCSLLDLWELSQHSSPLWLPDGTIRSHPSIEYLYYIRDRVDEQFAILHSELHSKDGKDKCLLWAARIVEYPIAWPQHISTINARLCDLLVKTLKAQYLPSVWAGNLEVLLWVFFVLATVQIPFGGRDWVVSQLYMLICSRYGDMPWPQGWRERELRNVQGFVWCDSYNTDRFHEICHELAAVTTVSATRSKIEVHDALPPLF